VQALAAANEYSPVSQSVHTVAFTAAISGENMPATQLMQLEDSSSSW